MKMRYFSLIFLLLVFGCSSTPDPGGDTKQEYSREDVARLEGEMREIDSLTNVSARKYYEVYMQLGEAYFQFEQYGTALEVLKKGLRLNARDYRYQLLTAKTEVKLGRQESAFSRVEGILKNTEDGEIREDAEKIKDELLEKGISLPEIAVPDMSEKYIYLLRAGEVEDIYVSAVANRLQEVFRITVKILDESMEPDRENFRDNHAKYFETVVKRFIEDNGRERYETAVRNLEQQDAISTFGSEEEAFTYFLYMLEEDGDELWAHNMGLIKDQYDANTILDQIRRGYGKRIGEDNCFGILAITPYDMYAKDYNFLFGWNGSDAAVMSYSRFVDETTPLSLEMKRVVMQAMSSTGFLIGIPRCTTDTCARAYPHSLEEQDRKEDILCAECKRNLIEIYGALD